MRTIIKSSIIEIMKIKAEMLNKKRKVLSPSPGHAPYQIQTLPISQMR
jgi:hypothetical protein